jgi:hypothetical protein
VAEVLEPIPRPRTSFLHRAVGAATLQVEAFEEVEHDRRANGQAAALVLGVSLSYGLGRGHLAPVELLADVALRFAYWGFWAGLTWAIGTKIFEGTATPGELVRTLGFAQAPGLLYVFAGIPVLEWFVELGVLVWIVVAAVVAIRQALDVTTARAVAIGLAGAAVYAVLLVARAWWL